MLRPVTPMRFSLPPIRKSFFFTGAVCLVASMTLAEPLRDDLTEKDRNSRQTMTALATDFTGPEPFEAMSGGATTSTSKADSRAFSHPSATMSFERKLDFKLGNALFQKLWVSSPSSTQASDGLGPLYNARSCQTCHVKDGRGRPAACRGRCGLSVSPAGPTGPQRGRTGRDCTP